MFKEMVRDLFQLSMKALDAGAYVHFSVQDTSADVAIMEAGWKKDADYDAYYMIHSEEELRELSEKEFQAAKEHLERLIREKSNEKE